MRAEIAFIILSYIGGILVGTLFGLVIAGR